MVEDTIFGMPDMIQALERQRNSAKDRISNLRLIIIEMEADIKHCEGERDLAEYMLGLISSAEGAK